VVPVGGAVADVAEAGGVSEELPFVQATAATRASGTKSAGRLRGRMDAA